MMDVAKQGLESNTIGSLIDTISRGICNHILEPCLMSPVVCWLGIIMVLQWHLRYELLRCAVTQSLARKVVSNYWRVFGRSLIILHIFYHPGWMWVRDRVSPFMLTCSLIVLDVCVFYAIRLVFEWRLNRKSAQGAEDQEPIVADQSSTTKEEEYLKKECVNSYYQDFSVPFRRILLYFWTQFALMSYFVYYCSTDPFLTEQIGKEGRTHDSDFSLLKWAVAVCLTILSGEEESGTQFYLKYWLYVYRVLFNNENDHKPDWDFTLKFMSRVVMDFIINGIFLSILRGITPIVLSVVGSIDFIKDALAFFFITKLDDWDNSRSLTTVVMSELQCNEWYEEGQLCQNDVKSQELKKWMGSGVANFFPPPMNPHATDPPQVSTWHIANQA